MASKKITIVGRNHYPNVNLSNQQTVFLKREPENAVDPNAIAAYTLTGEKFGHVTAKFAKTLVHELPVGQMLFAVVTSGHAGTYPCSVTPN